MTLLIAGLLLWCGVHLSSVLAAKLRTRLVASMGLLPYKSCFALLIITSVVLMVFGWRAIEPLAIYQPPGWGREATYVLVFFTFVLFVAAKRQTNIKRVLRHPQLTGVILWSVGHLLSNGDDRSLVLFVMIGIWAVLEIILINRRAGAWIKPEPVPLEKDMITLMAGVILYTVIFLIHPYISGVKLI